MPSGKRSFAAVEAPIYFALPGFLHLSDTANITMNSGIAMIENDQAI